LRKSRFSNNSLPASPSTIPPPTATVTCARNLEAAGTPIGPYDLQIAAIALTHVLILVTNNTREFSRVAGLTLEDWTIP
jgi:predicted nucleic acid-binding protein